VCLFFFTATDTGLTELNTG